MISSTAKRRDLSFKYFWINPEIIEHGEILGFQNSLEDLGRSGLVSSEPKINIDVFPSV